MSIKKYLFSENVSEIKLLIDQKFKNDLNDKFGHSNFPFTVKNINVNKFKRINVTAIFDEREIKEQSEINYGNVNRIRKIDKAKIKRFSFERKNCVLENIGKIEQYRVDDTDQSHTCGTCSGRKEVSCYMCNGKGKNRCGICNGKREVKCSNCNGSVNIDCWSCSGNGRKNEGYGENKRTVTCSSCNGRGSNVCSSCSNGYNTCGTCNGNGEVSCYTCNSSGKIGCSSCSSQGSFTRYLSVISTIVKKENNLVVEGNNPGDFISEKIISEKFTYQKDFIKYKVKDLKEFSTDLKEIFSGLLPNNNQKGTIVYASLEECVSLTFEIVVGESTYLGSLKNGKLNIDNSAFNLLFYDVINNLVVDSKFNNLINNKTAFEGNLKNVDKLWATINQYHEFTDIVTQKNSKSIFNINDKNIATGKITRVRKLDLIDTTKYLNLLRKKFFKNEFLRQILFTLLSIFILFIIFGRLGGIDYIGFSNFIQIPFISLAVATISAFYLINKLDKKPKKENVETNNVRGITGLGYIIVIIGFIITCFSLST
jgi:hypothetical protein|tara:strand:+ start:3029 stop:4645 length:1617 start_codon:yes stop_codon:yes gene_type:complete